MSISYAHGDHLAGVKGLAEDSADNVKNIAPAGLVETVSAVNQIASSLTSTLTSVYTGPDTVA